MTDARPSCPARICVGICAPNRVPVVARSFGVAVVVASLLAGCVVAPQRSVWSPTLPAQASVPAPNAPVYFYPERGQVDGRQDRDRYECYRWAVQESGSDPGMTPVRELRPRSAPPVSRDGAGVVAGAATGAVLGAAVSGPRHAGENMVIGAIFGAALGAAAQESRAQSAERAQAQAEARRQADSAAYRVPQDNFRRAMSACMQGRGYRVG